MKWYAHIITVILFLTSCGGISAKGREVATSPACVEDEYEARIAAIEEKKRGNAGYCRQHRHVLVLGRH